MRLLSGPGGDIYERSEIGTIFRLIYGVSWCALHACPGAGKIDESRDMNFRRAGAFTLTSREEHAVQVPNLEGYCYEQSTK